MIPSDHFVRFYSEVFKFLDTQNGLEEYYREIGRHQELHCYECFMDKGLDGMEEYWGHIRVEENCISSSKIVDGVRYSFMDRCPSLSKILDSDAEPCEKYCRHCPGWCIPLMTKCGFYYMSNIKSLTDPHCCSAQTEDIEKAKAVMQKWLDEGADPDMLSSNIDDFETVEANKKFRLERLQQKGK